MITKDECKEFALKYKETTGKFPSASSWKIKDGFPCGSSIITKLFGFYNNFRDYCEEPQLKRTEDLTLAWIKSNCTIDEKQCWNWNKFKNNYGQTVYNGKPCSVHRVSYILAYGEIPNGLLVRHKCDNKICCNPDHLELGTHSDNSLDTSIRNSDTKYNTNINLANKVRKLKTIAEKVDFYLSNVEITPENCHISILLQKHTDYKQISYRNKLYSLHRLILANKVGKDYNTLGIVRHTCHNKNCINPEHLIEGSRSDNALDSRELSKQTKLTKESVLQIKNALLSTKFEKHGDKGLFDSAWANKLNVGKCTITDIRLRRTWKDVVPTNE